MWYDGTQVLSQEVMTIMGIIDIAITQQRDLAKLRSENAQLRLENAQLHAACSGFRGALDVAWTIITSHITPKKKEDMTP